MSTLSFTPPFRLPPPAELVSDDVRASRPVVEGEVVLRELGEPARLPAVELLRLAEVLEVLVVGPDLELRRALEEVAPVLEAQHDREHFLVVDLVVALRVRHGLRVVCDGMPLSVILQLRQYSTCCVA